MSNKTKISGGIHAQMRFWRQHLKDCSAADKAKKEKYYKGNNKD